MDLEQVFLYLCSKVYFYPGSISGPTSRILELRSAVSGKNRSDWLVRLCPHQGISFPSVSEVEINLGTIKIKMGDPQENR